MTHAATLPFAETLTALEAAGEATRLRLLALLSEAELTVTELTAILGQSQPRVSRHLRLMVEAGLLERHREGAWAFFRRADRGARADLVSALIARLDPVDAVLDSDRRRLRQVRDERARQAAEYFSSLAPEWDTIRSAHVPDARVEAAILDLVSGARIESLLDIGTGTGRMLELLAPRASRAIGIDISPAMLAVARASLERAGLRNVALRQGDIYALPPGDGPFDLIMIHQVLHFLDDPARAIREACRLLAPGGRLLIADLAPHDDERLRSEFNHRRLGFAPQELASLMRDAGLAGVRVRELKPLPSEGKVLPVILWLGRDGAVQTDLPPRSTTLEVA